MAFLEVKNFNKVFGDKVVALKDVNFTLEKGKVLSIIGHSGSGKTTLLRCINFLTELDGGEMILDGEVLMNVSSTEKLAEKTLREKRLNFGLVFQSFNLFPQYSVIENLMLAPKLRANTKGSKKPDPEQMKNVASVFYNRMKNPNHEGTCCPDHADENGFEGSGTVF